MAGIPTPNRPWTKSQDAEGTPGSKAKLGAPVEKGGAVVQAIERIQKDREARRLSAQHRKAERAKAEVDLADVPGVPVNAKVDKATLEFMRMIAAYRDEHEGEDKQHAPAGSQDICVVVRKRPINKREVAVGDYDAVTCMNPRAVVHAPKYKVDGITKYLENTNFQFDHTFNETESTPDIYQYTVLPLVAHAFQNKGRGTCFAYGQTGSGKTYTMSGIQRLVARDLFRALAAKEYSRLGLTVGAAFYEIYGGRAFDVLHDRQLLQIRENEKQRVVIVGLQEVACENEDDLMDVIARGNSSRTTHSTEVNEVSSRSHAICEITLRTKDGRVHGSLSLIDLAGSERAADSKNHNQQRRIESAEINKSLLGLKECIRALATRASLGDDVHVHVPFRASKLTLALRDSFVSPNARVVMIATVSPNAASWDHTSNTLRYADRVKEKPSDMGGLGDGHAAAGGAGGGHPGHGREITFSFLQSDAKGSGADSARSNGSGAGGPRVSPLTVGGGDGGDGIIEARAPPRPIFQRMKGSDSKPSVGGSVKNNPADSRWDSNSDNEGTGGRGEIATPQPLRAGAAAAGARRVKVSKGHGREGSGKQDDDDLDDGDYYNDHTDNVDDYSRGHGDDGDGRYDFRFGGDGEERDPFGIRSSSSSSAAAAVPSSGSHGYDHDGRRGAEQQRHQQQQAAASRGLRLKPQSDRESKSMDTDGEGDGAGSGRGRGPTGAASGVGVRSPSSSGLGGKPPTAAAGGGGSSARGAPSSSKVKSPPSHERGSSVNSSLDESADDRAGSGGGGVSTRSRSAAHASAMGPEGAGMPTASQQQATGFKRLLQKVGISKDGKATAAPAAGVPAAAMPVGRQQLPAAEPRPSTSSGRKSSNAGADSDGGSEVSGAPPPSLPMKASAAAAAQSKSLQDKLREKGKKATSTGAAVGAAAALPSQQQVQVARPGTATGPGGPALVRPGTGSKSSAMPTSPETKKDIAMLHETLRREMKSSSAAANQAAADRSNGGSSQGGKASSNGFDAAHMYHEHVPTAEEIDAADDQLMQLHEAVELIIDEEQALLESHVIAIQENAQMLQDEGALLASVQRGPDYDISSYATRLRYILERKRQQTEELLAQVTKFQEHLAVEEQVSAKMDAKAMRLV